MLEKQRKSTNQVCMRDGEYEFLVVRHPRFQWLQQQSKFIYFLYITRKQTKIINENGDKKTFNVHCHIQMFLNYHYLLKSLTPILEEYILDEQRLSEFVLHVMELAMHDFGLEMSERTAKFKTEEKDFEDKSED